MTWLGDKKPLPEGEAAKLIVKREGIVQKIQALQKLNGTHKTQSGARFHLEDLTKLAKEITSIDRKLGRV